jgi:hypothetical protein
MLRTPINVRVKQVEAESENGVEIFNRPLIIYIMIIAPKSSPTAEPGGFDTKSKYIRFHVLVVVHPWHAETMMA